jgi:predicted solute-binding protein
MFNCEPCQYTTDLRYRFLEHTRSTTHFLKTGERKEDYKFVCIPCGFKCYYKSKYEAHEKTKGHKLRIGDYIPEKYSCDLCDYWSDYWSYSRPNFNVHMYRHRHNKDYKKLQVKEKQLEKINKEEHCNDDELLKVKISEQILKLYEQGKNPNNFFNYSFYANRNLDLNNQELNNFLYELKSIV